MDNSGRPSILAHLDRHILRALQQVVNIELAESGAECAPRFACGEELSPYERYAPMRRLLVSEGTMLPSKGSTKGVVSGCFRKLEHEHVRCYFMYLAVLRREVRGALRDRVLAMESTQNWNVQPYLSRWLYSERILLQLRWMGWRKRLGLAVNVLVVGDLLDFLLADALASEAQRV